MTEAPGPGRGHERLETEGPAETGWETVAQTPIARRVAPLAPAGTGTSSWATTPPTRPRGAPIQKSGFDGALSPE
jgi:hypothetical protein